MKGSPSSSSILTWPHVSITLTSCGIRKWKLMTWNTFYFPLFFLFFFFLNLIYSGCLKSGIVTWIPVISVARSLILKLRLTANHNVEFHGHQLCFGHAVFQKQVMMYWCKPQKSSSVLKGLLVKEKNIIILTAFNFFFFWPRKVVGMKRQTWKSFRKQAQWCFPAVGCPILLP